MVVVHSTTHLSISPLPTILQASIKVKATQDNVAGVKLPKFESFKEGVDSKLGLIGLGSGGKQIQECRCVGNDLGMGSRCAGALDLNRPPSCRLFVTLDPQKVLLDRCGAAGGAGEPPDRLSDPG